MQAKGKHGLWALLGCLPAFVLLVSSVAGCVPDSSLNVSKQAGLAHAIRLEIAELVIQPTTEYVAKATVTDQATLNRLSRVLDANLRLGPLAECLAQYRLSFIFSSGDVQVFDYYCAGGVSFLRGDQGFWSGQQVQPPAEFDAAMAELLRAAVQ